MLHLQSGVQLLEVYMILYLVDILSVTRQLGFNNLYNYGFESSTINLMLLYSSIFITYQLGLVIIFISSLRLTILIVLKSSTNLQKFTIQETLCVQQNNCAPGYLNFNSTFCIENCTSEQKYAFNNKCVECSFVNSLSEWQGTCKCLNEFGVDGMFPSCKCKSGFILNGNKCECFGKISLDGNTCGKTCPPEQVLSVIQCQICPLKSPANIDQTECQRDVCSKSIIKGGVEYIYCIKGSQNNKQISKQVVFQGNTEFHSAFLFEAEQISNLVIQNHVIDQQNTYSLNIFSQLIISESNIDLNLQLLAFSGINAYNGIEIFNTQVNLTVKGCLITAICYQGKQERNGFHVNLQQTNINMTLNSTNGIIQLIYSQEQQIVYLQKVVINAQISATHSYIGLSGILNLTNIENLRYILQFKDSIQYFFGLSRDSNDCYILNSIFEVQVNQVDQYSGLSQFATGYQYIENSKINVDIYNGSINDFYGLCVRTQNITVLAVNFSVFQDSGSFVNFYGVSMQVMDQVIITNVIIAFDVKQVNYVMYSITQSSSSILLSASSLTVSVCQFLREFYGISEYARTLSVQDSNISFSLTGDQLYGLSYIVSDLDLFNVRFSGSISFKNELMGLISHYSSLQIKYVELAFNFSSIFSQNKLYDFQTENWKINFLDAGKGKGISCQTVQEQEIGDFQMCS
ncbi:Hypothetical_protein [Hexamita inflata]|uniref:Hypothetical_protein n=1 Tax=Hexamita inflata TaxID=28002 RepID=A0AA86QXJ6_9EUKA|nr:Hypothetical protein HINF_LOCUS47005 [Hexamita inflata]